MSQEMGRRVRDAVAAVAGPPAIKQIVLIGYANEYLHYFVTPEEYEMQHYEGGSTLFGRYSSDVLRDSLVQLASSLTAGKPAPEAHPFDSTNGVVPDYTPYDKGASAGTARAQPTAVKRLERAKFGWQGGERGYDRPLDNAFVRVERRVRRGWREAANDLGLEILWRVDDKGAYTAEWQVPLDARVGSYRFVVTANKYVLRSQPFRVSPATNLMARIVGIARRRARVALDYPPVDDANDLFSHPKSASGGRVVADVAKHRVVATARRGDIVVPLRRAKTLTILSATDRWGNRIGRGP
jgi:hypothetical protein